MDRWKNAESLQTQEDVWEKRVEISRMRGRGRSEKQNQQQAEAAGIDYLWPTLDMVIVLSAVAAADLLPPLLLEVNRLNFFGLGELATSLLLKIMFGYITLLFAHNTSMLIRIWFADVITRRPKPAWCRLMSEPTRERRTSSARPVHEHLLKSHSWPDTQGYTL